MIKNFLKDRISELHNVTWPTQKQAIHSMVMVLTIMLLIGVFLGFVDLLFNKVVLKFI
jgi:preprotein translocase SecE subunit